MTTWYAQTAGGNWNSGVMWNSAANGSGSFGTPGDGDTCDLNGKSVVMDIATIPASGTLAALNSPGTAGRLTLAMSGSNNYTIRATAITAGTSTSGLITASGSAPSAALTIHGNCTAGSSTGAYCVDNAGTGTVTINGNVTGGSGASYLGGAYNSASGTLIINGNVTGGSGGSMAVGMQNSTSGAATINGNVLSGASAVGAANAGSGSLTIVGNVTSGAATVVGVSISSGILTVTGQVASVNYPAIQMTGTGTVTINGNVTGGSGASYADGLSCTSGGTATINGNVTGGANSGANGVIIYGSCSVTINGNVTGGSHRTAYGISNAVTGTVTINGNLIHTASTCAVVGPCLANSAAGRYSQHVQTGGTTFKQYREDAFVTAAQVQSGVTFWANGVSGTGSGAFSIPPGPDAATLTIADNGNNTGATATIASGSAGASNVVYAMSADANLSTGTWASAGSRTGNGTASLSSLAAGRYWGYLEATLNSQEVATAPIHFIVTSGDEAIYKQILDAVRSRIVATALSGIADASILVRKVNTQRGIGTQEASPAIAYPAIVVSPFGAEVMPANAGTNERDDIGYAVMVSVVDADEQSLEANMNRNLLWRQQIRQAFHNQRLAGVQEVNRCTVEPRDVTRFADWVSGKYVSLLVLRFTSRETRGI